MKTLQFVFSLLFLLITSFGFSKNVNTVVSSGTGDLILPLGKFKIGTSIDVELDAVGGWAEIGGRYQVVAGWNRMPVVTQVSMSDRAAKFRFYAYLANTSYMYLFAKWDNTSPSEGYNNSVKVTTSTVREHVPSDTGSFNSATQLESRLVMDYSSNKIGIGTDSPDHELDVKGTIRAEEVIVETGWADYVFEDGYELPTLSQVSAHIHEHGHLPGIPSAEEVRENGLALADSQALMMAKIEELTLYMIEKDKRIEQLERENARLSTLESRLTELEAIVQAN